MSEKKKEKTFPCAAINCDRDVTSTESVRFSSVPETALKWAKAVGLDKYKPNSRICLLHFDVDKDFDTSDNGYRRIKKDVEPTKNLPTVSHFIFHFDDYKYLCGKVRESLFTLAYTGCQGAKGRASLILGIEFVNQANPDSCLSMSMIRM